MNRLESNTQAPEFELTDARGNIIRLADFSHKKIIFLVLNRGFG